MRDERKSLLYRYPALGSELADLAEKIADLEGKLQAHYERLGTTLDADRVGGTGPGDPTAEAADYVMRLKSRLDRLYAASEWRLVALGRVGVSGPPRRAGRPAVELRYFQRLGRWPRRRLYPSRRCTACVCLEEVDAKG